MSVLKEAIDNILNDKGKFSRDYIPTELDIKLGLDKIDYITLIWVDIYPEFKQAEPGLKLAYYKTEDVIKLHLGTDSLQDDLGDVLEVFKDVNKAITFFKEKLIFLVKKYNPWKVEVWTNNIKDFDLNFLNCDENEINNAWDTPKIYGIEKIEDLEKLENVQDLKNPKKILRDLDTRINP